MSEKEQVRRDVRHLMLQARYLESLADQLRDLRCPELKEQHEKSGLFHHQFNHVAAGFPEWLRRIGEKLSDAPQTFLCHHCRDKGYRLRTDADGLVWGSICDCEKGRGIAQQEKVDAARRAIEEAKRLKSRRYKEESIMEQAEKIMGEEPGEEDLPF